ncbi:MAG TPA: ATP-binding protein [Bryobacteraceae bacterium]|nr:ATP-binding protein [Bryobacteraceae bacterium]
MFSRSRIALAVGFGGLLSIMALAGIDALRVLQHFRRSDDQIRRHYLAENHVLNDIRSDVYVSGTYVRDYLLEPEPERAEDFRTSLEAVRKHMQTALDSYGQQVGPAEGQHYTTLRAELADYWDILAPIFHWDAAERRRSGYAFLRDQVFPRRQHMLELASRIDDLNERQLDAGNRQVVALLLDFQTRLLLTLFAALALGIGLALFTMRKIFGLEDRARSQYIEVEEARTQLKGLSARLVQAQEDERRSLSRELHDEVGQALTAVLVELRNLSSGIAVRSEEQSRRHVETIKALVEGTVRVVRNMALLLRPSMLDDLGLIPALKWQARECSKSTPMDVTVDTELDSDELPDEYKTCIYRVVQEALHNSTRHSRAATVRIRVVQEHDRLRLTIQDDGQGFDAGHTKGLGLLGIQERVTRLGGNFRVHSQPGHGTRLSIELPFREENRSVLIGETDSHPVG